MGEHSHIGWTESKYGPSANPPRDGDKRQARQRVNVLVRTGRGPHPNTIPCADCGHVWAEGERRHEYDHFLGYAAAHHYDVQSVCTLCQRRRSMERGEIKVVNLKRAAAIKSANRKQFCAEGHQLVRGTDGHWRCHECRKAYWRERGRKHSNRLDHSHA